MNSLQHTSKIIIHKPLDEVFTKTLTIELSLIFKDWKKYSGVKSASEEKNWLHVGQERKVEFNDNTFTKELLTSIISNQYFAYIVSDFTDFHLKIGLKSIEGSWDFKEICDNQTEVSWTYKANPKHFIARWMLKKVVKNDLPHIMAQGVSNLKKELEK
jgi:hypothetical protein